MSAVPPVSAANEQAMRVVIAMAALAALATALAPMMAPLTLPLAAAMALLGFYNLSVGRAVARTHAASQATTRGLYDLAEGHLAAIPRWQLRKGSVMRSVYAQRAMLALHRGDPKAAVEIVGPALTQATKHATRVHEQMQRALALALRAFAHAALGDAERARADIAEVLASRQSTPEALARARLAEALVASRARDHDAVMRTLRDHGGLIAEYALPRERALARALAGAVETRSGGVYREAAKVDLDPREANAVAEWIATMAPEAGMHATRAPMHNPGPPGPATEPMRVSPPARAPEAPSRSRVLGVAAAAFLSAFVVSFLAVGYVTPTLGVLLGTVAVASIPTAAMYAVRVRQRHELEQDMLDASRAMALGASAELEQALVRMESRKSGLSYAHACLLRARLADQHAQFSRSMNLCSSALEHIRRQMPAMQMLAAASLTPSLHLLRSTALAALGHEAQANADLATLAREHDAWQSRALAEFRTKLVMAIRRNDVNGARAIARTRTAELPLPQRDEALVELLLATTDGAPHEDRVRVDRLLRDDALVRTWVDAVAPGLREELARTTNAPRTRVGSDESESEHEQEHEHEHEGKRLSSRS